MAGSYDFIYGSVVEIECQAQININECKEDKGYTNYLYIIKKDWNSFKKWCQLKNDIICMVKSPSIETLDQEVLEKVNIGTQKDDYLDEWKRVICWTNDERKIKKGKASHLSGPGHGKQLLILKHATYCARYTGPDFKIPDYSRT
jgi:hypothetical protein